MTNFKTKIAVLVLISGILSFIHLFGIEKALFTIIFGSFVISENKLNAEQPSKLAITGILLGFIYIVILLVIAIIKGPEFFNIFKNIMMNLK
jgi:hypothetical protein